MIKKVILFISLFTLTAFPQEWYKGNLHTHSLWSDGDDFPEMIMNWYKDHGYQFITLSDHNILADSEKWVKFGNQDKAYVEYKSKFGGSIYEKPEGDSVLVRLKTLEEYRPLFEENGKFLIIESEEITDKFENKPIHINANNIRELIKPQGGNSILEVMQNDIDAVIAQRIRTDITMFPHVNHPNFGWAITAEDIINLKGDKFFEIYNGHPYVNNYGDSVHQSTEDMWDEILRKRLRADEDPVYGLAVDDAHNYLERGLKNANPGRGWIVVRTSVLSADSLIAAMEKGDFYASTGVELAGLERDNKK